MDPITLIPVTIFILFFGGLAVDQTMVSKEHVKSESRFVMDYGVYKCNQVDGLSLKEPQPVKLPEAPKAEAPRAEMPIKKVHPVKRKINKAKQDQKCQTVQVCK